MVDTVLVVIFNVKCLELESIRLHARLVVWVGLLAVEHEYSLASFIFVHKFHPDEAKHILELDDQIALQEAWH